MKKNKINYFNFILKYIIMEIITKGSSRGATVSFTLRSKGEGGQPRYLIFQEIARYFSNLPPSTLPTHPKCRLKIL